MLTTATTAMYVDMWDTHNCSGGAPIATIELSSHSESRCTQCWSRCAHDKPKSPGHNSYVLRGPANAQVKAALNANCIGSFAYSGGWQDASMGGVISIENGSTSSACHEGGASALVLCSGSVEGMNDDLQHICGAPPLVPPPPPSADAGAFYVLDPAAVAKTALGTDYEWAKANVPFIDVGGSSTSSSFGALTADIVTAFYYRWRVLKKHIVWTQSDGAVITEFKPYVPWAGRHDTIPAAAGHHIAEATWLHDTRVASDYESFWLGATPPSGDATTYTNWIGHAALRRYYATGNTTHFASLQPGYVAGHLRFILNGSKATAPDADGTTVCWSQSDGSDAMEVSISGNGCRPTYAAAMWGEAVAVLKMTDVRLALLREKQKKQEKQEKQKKKEDDLEVEAMIAREKALRVEFIVWRDFSAKVVRNHWNNELKTFATIALGGGTSTTTQEEAMTMGDPLPPDCNLTAVRPVGEPAKVRELLGFMPWFFNGLLSSRADSPDATFMTQWAQLWNEDGGFAAKWGLRTAERRHACYNYSWTHGDCWNGPSWPYETARILTAAANILHAPAAAAATTRRTENDKGASSSSSSSLLNRSTYVALLAQYAAQHTRSFAANDTASPVGSGHVFENIHPDTGVWNNRRLMYDAMGPNRDQGNDYLHSTFNDLVLGGFFGIVPLPSNRTLLIDPLMAVEGEEKEALDHWAVDHLRVLGRNLAVVWDRDGTHYDNLHTKIALGKGLIVILDGKVVARSATIAPLRIAL